MCIESELDSVPEPNISVHLSDKKNENWAQTFSTAVVISVNRNAFESTREWWANTIKKVPEQILHN